MFEELYVMNSFIKREIFTLIFRAMLHCLLMTLCVKKLNASACTFESFNKTCRCILSKYLYLISSGILYDKGFQEHLTNQNDVLFTNFNVLYLVRHAILMYLSLLYPNIIICVTRI